VIEATSNLMDTRVQALFPFPVLQVPKILPPDARATRRSDEFMKLWHVELAADAHTDGSRSSYHSFPVEHSPRGSRHAGDRRRLGEHLNQETLSPEQGAVYYCNEIPREHGGGIQRRFPTKTVVGDCQQRLEFSDGYFDRYGRHLPYRAPAT